MMLVDKESGKSFVQMEETTHKNKEYASKGVAGTALGLGIAGAAGWLLNGGLFGCGNGLFGGCGNRCGNNAALGAAIAADTMNDHYLERKECADYVALINGMWQKSYDQQKERFADRQTINEEMFGIYKSTRDGFDVLNAKHNKDSFDLYKLSRDNKDELSSEIGALRTEVAVMKAVRPYQDALIKCDIQKVADQANFNLFHRTCRMITGQVILPEKPLVAGYGSYTPCCPVTEE